MRRIYSVIGALASAMMAAPAMSIFTQSGGQIAEAIAPRNRARRKKVVQLDRTLPKARRAKWKAGGPKKHRNLNHVSRRTRRKHRRGKAL